MYFNADFDSNGFFYVYILEKYLQLKKTKAFARENFWFSP